MLPIRQEVHALLEVGTFVKHGQTRQTCCNILNVEQALWAFVDQEGVEPTNNAAERALRRGVIWRRRSFGTQSEAGSRFVERILTVVITLRQQKRDVLDYLTEACQASTLGIAPPSLLPAT
jgi:transposase